ncbi:MAG TPA: hypothetical protein VN253_27830 [Kofleriaceae bacterium]|nr:hypothetical protein [Kofleriaceae bacterium]
MFTKIDSKQLSNINGGVRPGPNGEGCTGPFPRPNPRPTDQTPGVPPLQLPGGNLPLS